VVFIVVGGFGSPVTGWLLEVIAS